MTESATYALLSDAGTTFATPTPTPTSAAGTATGLAIVFGSWPMPNPDFKQATTVLGKILASGQNAATTPTTIYTLPASFAVKLATLAISNTTSTAVTVTVSIVPSGGTVDGTHKMLSSFQLAALDTISQERPLGYQGRFPRRLCVPSDHGVYRECRRLPAHRGGVRLMPGTSALQKRTPAARPGDRRYRQSLGRRDAQTNAADYGTVATGTIGACASSTAITKGRTLTAVGPTGSLGVAGKQYFAYSCAGNISVWGTSYPQTLAVMVKSLLNATTGARYCIDFM